RRRRRASLPSRRFVLEVLLRAQADSELRVEAEEVRRWVAGAAERALPRTPAHRLLSSRRRRALLSVGRQPSPGLRAGREEPLERRGVHAKGGRGVLGGHGLDHLAELAVGLIDGGRRSCGVAWARTTGSAGSWPSAARRAS